MAKRAACVENPEPDGVVWFSGSSALLSMVNKTVYRIVCLPSANESTKETPTENKHAKNANQRKYEEVRKRIRCAA